MFRYEPPVVGFANLRFLIFSVQHLRSTLEFVNSKVFHALWFEWFNLWVGGSAFLLWAEWFAIAFKRVRFSFGKNPVRGFLWSSHWAVRFTCWSWRMIVEDGPLIHWVFIWSDWGLGFVGFWIELLFRESKVVKLGFEQDLLNRSVVLVGFRCFGWLREDWVWVWKFRNFLLGVMLKVGWYVKPEFGFLNWPAKGFPVVLQQWLSIAQDTAYGRQIFDCSWW
jgi:hypothetical protein